jgi:hypothetical protein
LNIRSGHNLPLALSAVMALALVLAIAFSMEADRERHIG